MLLNALYCLDETDADEVVVVAVAVSQRDEGVVDD
jgi:hypothetical protein